MVLLVLLVLILQSLVWGKALTDPNLQDLVGQAELHVEARRADLLRTGEPMYSGRDLQCLYLEVSFCHQQEIGKRDRIWLVSTAMLIPPTKEQTTLETPT